MAAEGGGGPTRHAGWRWIGVSCVLAFVVWHTIFDVTIDRAMKAYVAGQARHVRGEGPARNIRGEMGEARRSGAWYGLAGAGGVLLVSWAAARLVAARRVSG